MIKIKLDEKTKTNPLKEIGIQRAEGNLYNKIWFVRVHMEKEKKTRKCSWKWETGLSAVFKNVSF